MGHILSSENERNKVHPECDDTPGKQQGEGEFTIAACVTVDQQV